MANEQEIQVVNVQSATNDADSIMVQVPVRTITDLKIGYDVLRYIPEESAEHYKIAPLAVTDGVLEVGMLNPENIEGIDALNFIAKATGMPFKVFRISQTDFDSWCVLLNILILIFASLWPRKCRIIEIKQQIF